MYVDRFFLRLRLLPLPAIPIIPLITSWLWGFRMSLEMSIPLVQGSACPSHPRQYSTAAGRPIFAVAFPPRHSHRGTAQRSAAHATATMYSYGNATMPVPVSYRFLGHMHEVGRPSNGQGMETCGLGAVPVGRLQDCLARRRLAFTLHETR